VIELDGTATRCYQSPRVGARSAKDPLTSVGVTLYETFYTGEVRHC
jgi:hypothetical protein